MITRKDLTLEKPNELKLLKKLPINVFNSSFDSNSEEFYSIM